MGLAESRWAMVQWGRAGKPVKEKQSVLVTSSSLQEITDTDKCYLRLVYLRDEKSFAVEALVLCRK